MTSPAILASASLKDPHEAVLLLAVEVLDALIAELIGRSGQTVEHDFLDWVADELTPDLEAALADAMRSQRFMESLMLGDPRIGLLAWIKHWVCPRIRLRFDRYSVYCPCKQDVPVIFYKVVR
jgi:hypothetical protein